MPKPKDRSNSVRKIKRRMPTGDMRIRYVRRAKGKVHHCSACGATLQGTHSTSTLSHSAKAPNRKYAGNLCASCSRRVIILQSRVNEGALTLDAVEVKFLPYVKKGQ